MTSLLTFGSKLSLVLCMLVLMPRVGLAAEAVPVSSGLPGTSERAPLRLSGDSWATEPAPSRPSRGPRILAEVGIGLATGAGLGLAGALAGGGLCGVGVLGTRSQYLPCFDTAGIGALLGAGFGLPLGVFLGGEAAGGNGKLYGAMLGMASGVGAGALLGMLSGSFSSVDLLIIPLAVGGSILGYELTERGGAAPQAPAAPIVASARPRLQPVLSLSANGALVGLGGSF